MKRHIPIILLLIFHGLFTFVYRFTAWPEMLTYPWLISNGYRFYVDIVHPYLPLLPYLLLIFYKLLGFSVFSLRIVTLLFQLTADLLVYKIVKKKYGLRWALISTSFYMIMQVILEGNGLWFDLASVPLVLFTFLMLENNIWVAGLSLGLAVLTKQTNVIFAYPALISVSYKSRWTFVKIVLAPLVFVSIIYLFKGQVKDLWYWGLTYPITTLSRMEGFVLFPTLKQLLVIIAIFFPILLLTRKLKVNNNTLILCFIISLVFAFPRFAYFHLQPAIALYCLILPYVIRQISNKYRLVFLISYSVLVLGIFGIFMIKNLERPVRFFEPEVIEARSLLSQKFSVNTVVYFYNVPAQYFVNSSLLPVKPWVDTFPWYMELPGMQNRIINSLEETNYLIFRPFIREDKYGLGAYEPQEISAYIQNNFEPIDKVDDSLIIMKRKN